MLFEPAVDAPRYPARLPDELIDVASLRAAIRNCRKVAIAYEDEQGRPTERVIWPLALGYFEMSRIVVAWCELRADFRHFRTDRVRKAEISQQRYPGSRVKLLAKWRGTLAGGAAP